MIYLVPWVMQWFEKMSGIGLARCRHFLDQKKVDKESAARGLFLVLLRSHRKSGLCYFLLIKKVTIGGVALKAEQK